MPNIQFQFRRGSATEWSTANTVLANGEIGIETTTNQFKIGNGSTAWNSLSYGGLNGAVGYTGSQGNISSNATLIQFRETTIASGNITGNVSFDVANGTVFNANITGNISNLTLANVTNGTSATLILKHAGGPFTLTTTNAWLFAGNVKTLSTTANATDIISVVHSANVYYAAITKGFA